jgi:hypothetical protein
MTAKDIRGSYDLIVDNTTFKLLIKGEKLLLSLKSKN